MKVLIVDNGSKHLRSLKKVFKPFGRRVVKLRDLNLNLVDKFDFIVLSRGHKFTVVNHRKEYAREIELIKKCHKPLLGICLGAELIAASFGSKLKKMKNREHGILALKLQQRSKLFKNIPALKVYEGHRWVVGVLSRSLIPLARSRDGVEMFRHKTRPIFGFQFHPEIIADKKHQKLLWNNLIRLIQTGG